MKKEHYLIIGFIILVYIVCLLFINNRKLDINLIEIGEEKYLEFLWMVDGAFNSDLDEFTINGKKLDDSKKVFTCKYSKSNKDECIGNNFVNSFRNLFANSISYDDVYSDGRIYTWYRYEKDKYIFNNNHNCSIDRMPINQELVIDKVEDNLLTFKAVYKNDHKIRESRNTFELIKENNVWKVNKAYYYDICGLEYYIK